ncbi:MAG TPA: glycosyltransferase family 4 protein [Pseudohaliea sp.]|nr:glycosyltransferase family 4 protein [Pseudohaliea sp.]
MKILFCHQNFPGQYKHIAPAIARRPGVEAVCIGEQVNTNRIDPAGLPPGLRLAPYETPRGPSPDTHHYIRGFEGHVRRGQAVARKAVELRQQGFVPDVIAAHPGWGEALFLKDVFPRAPLLAFAEFFYRARGSDVGFDPEYPVTFDDHCRVRVKNATLILSLEAADWIVCPTRWQARQLPAGFAERLSIVHDGIDTERVHPDPSARLTLADSNLELKAGDEVITFVNRNLEPYRGFHVFLRALPEIQRRRPRAHVLILGGDDVSYGKALPEGETYRQRLLAELGDRLDLSRLHFLGRIPYGQFLKVLQVSAVHVYLTYPFVLSWSMLEAMAAGCLVIGSATPPVAEVLEDGKTGLLVDFFDRDGIAERIDGVLDHPDRMQALRTRARQAVIDGYDLRSVCLPRHLALIEDLAAGRRPEPDRVGAGENESAPGKAGSRDTAAAMRAALVAKRRRPNRQS